MNPLLQEFARDQIKAALARSTDQQQRVFLCRHSFEDQSRPLAEVVDDLPVDSLDHILTTVTARADKPAPSPAVEPQWVYVWVPLDQALECANVRRLKLRRLTKAHYHFEHRYELAGYSLRASRTDPRFHLDARSALLAGKVQLQQDLASLNDRHIALVWAQAVVEMGLDEWAFASAPVFAEGSYLGGPIVSSGSSSSSEP